MGRPSRFAWICLGLLAGVAVWFWFMDKRSAAIGTLVAGAGCLGLILPPRERMGVLPWRLRALPRRFDAAPVLASLTVTPGYGLGWFYGVNPYDEVVHLLNGILAGAVFAALLDADGRPRGLAERVKLGLAFGLGLGLAWEGFEWLTSLIGNWTDTWTDIVLTAFGATLGTVFTPSRPGRPRA